MKLDPRPIFIDFENPTPDEIIEMEHAYHCFITAANDLQSSLLSLESRPGLLAQLILYISSKNRDKEDTLYKLGKWSEHVGDLLDKKNILTPKERDRFVAIKDELLVLKDRHKHDAESAPAIVNNFDVLVAICERLTAVRIQYSRSEQESKLYVLAEQVHHLTQTIQKLEAKIVGARHAINRFLAKSRRNRRKSPDPQLNAGLVPVAPPEGILDFQTRSLYQAELIEQMEAKLEKAANQHVQLIALGNQTSRALLEASERIQSLESSLADHSRHVREEQLRTIEREHQAEVAYRQLEQEKRAIERQLEEQTRLAQIHHEPKDPHPRLESPGDSEANEGPPSEKDHAIKNSELEAQVQFLRNRERELDEEISSLKAQLDQMAKEAFEIQNVIDAPEPRKVAFQESAPPQESVPDSPEEFLPMPVEPKGNSNEIHALFG